MRKRTNQITIRLQPFHYKKIQKKAKKANLSISEFIRKAIRETEFRLLPDEDYIEMAQKVRAFYFQILELEKKVNYERYLPMKTLDKSLELNLKIKDILMHYHQKEDALGNSKKFLKLYGYTRQQHRLCIRLNDEEKAKLDKLLTKTTISQNIVVQRLCLKEAIPFKKPEAYYETLRYLNEVGDFRLKLVYQYADTPKEAWDKICEIQEAQEVAMELLLDFA